MNNNSDDTYIYILFILLIVIFFVFRKNKINNTAIPIMPIVPITPAKIETRENMSPGVIDQLFAKDMQDMNLNGKEINGIASGRFNLFWNQPTLIANTNNNRGVLYNESYANPLIKSQYVRGSGSEAGLNYEELNKITKQVANINDNNTVNRKNNVFEINRVTSKLEPVTDLASYGTGAGGYWLNSDIVNPIYNYNKPEFVGLNGELIYPDDYISALFVPPIQDINYPYPVVSNPI